MMIRKLAGALRARLIPNARAAWRMWSVRLSAFGTLIYGAALAWPDGALALWNLMPAEVRARVPEPFGQILAFALFAAVIAVRLLKQKDVPDETST